MNKVFSLALLMVSLPAAASSSTYLCKSAAGGESAKIVVDANNNISFPLELPAAGTQGAKPVGPQTTDQCLPKGQGGFLFDNGGGPGYWVYRIPQTALNGAKSILVELAVDEDSDGVCDYTTLSCRQQ